MAYSSGTVKYLQTVLLFFKPGTSALTYRLEHEVKKTGLSFHDFLNSNKHKCFHLVEKEKCCQCVVYKQRSKSVLTKHQWDELFTATSNPCNTKTLCLCKYQPKSNISEDHLEFSILCAILKNVCSLQPGDLQDIKNLREKRNFHIHDRSKTMENDIFQKEFSCIKSMIESIAYPCGTHIFSKIVKEIESIANGHLNDNICRYLLSTIYHIEEKNDEKLEKVCQDIEQLTINLRRQPNSRIISSEKPKNGDDLEEAAHSFVENASSNEDIPRYQMEIDLSHFHKKSSTSLHISCQEGDFDMTEYILSKNLKSLHDLDDDGLNAAHYAIAGGNIRILELLVDKGISLQVVSNRNKTILHFACEAARYEMCKYILANHPDMLHNVDSSNWNAAHFAVRGGDLRIFQLLVENGISLNVTTKEEKMNVFHISCAENKFEIFEYIVSIRPDLLHSLNIYGWNASHCAAQGGNVSMLQVLLSKGISVNVPTENDMTILNIACISARYEMCKYILSNYPDMVHNVSERGWTTAHSAAQGGDVRILQLVADKGVSLTDKTTDSESTILHISCITSRYQMCKHILSIFPNMLWDTDKWKFTAAHRAAEGGDIRVLELMLEKGMRFDVVSESNMTILHKSCKFGRFEMCSHIVTKYPSIIHNVDKEGVNAAHFAALGGDIGILKLLVNKGVSLKDKTKEKKVPLLHIACQVANYEMCEYILSNVPDTLHELDFFDHTAAHRAAQGGDIRVLQLLVQKGISVYATTKLNQNILHCALNFAKYDMCKHIISKYPDMLHQVDGRGWNALKYAILGKDTSIMRLLEDNGVFLNS